MQAAQIRAGWRLGRLVEHGREASRAGQGRQAFTVGLAGRHSGQERQAGRAEHASREVSGGRQGRAGGR
jgi:hypothetical protein